MINFICLCGLPASGKSTLALRLSEKYNAVILSSDQLRIELYDNIDDQEHNEEVFKELHRRIIQNIKNNKSVIYDATNISYKRRKALLEELQKFHCNKVCYLMATPYEDCLKQNQIRQRQVPEYVIKKMYLNFYIPQKYEGWDDIKIEWSYKEGDFSFDKLSEMTDIPQDNPHHTLTIKGHCFKCFEVIKTINRILKEAAVYHDIGKVFTKGFKDAKGEPSEIAHYYQHHLVSAYNAMFYLRKNPIWTDNDILEMCNYIQWHMRPFDINTEKAKNKFIRLVGQEFYDNLMILHNADIEAH